MRELAYLRDCDGEMGSKVETDELVAQLSRGML